MRRAIPGLLMLGVASMAGAAERKTPYWASLNAGEVMMRTGPGRNFPADWLYTRKGLPVRVVKTYAVAHSEWRRIRDPDGAEGWVQANLLSDQRTALVTGDVRPLRERPATDAVVTWRAEPGVVGRLSQCGRTWCLLDVRGQKGFVEVGHIFGIDPGETLP